MYKDDEQEKKFRLQIFQHTIAIMCDIPLRILNKKVDFSDYPAMPDVLAQLHATKLIDEKIKIIKDNYYGTN